MFKPSISYIVFKSLCMYAGEYERNQHQVQNYKHSKKWSDIFVQKTGICMWVCTGVPTCLPTQSNSQSQSRFIRSMRSVNSLRRQSQSGVSKKSRRRTYCRYLDSSSAIVRTQGWLSRQLTSKYLSYPLVFFFFVLYVCIIPVIMAYYKARSHRCADSC